MNKLKPRRLGHMVLMVRDIQKSAKFYTEVVGLEVSDWIGENMVFLRAGTDHHDLALAQMRRFRAIAGAELPLIGVGGIASAEQAWQRIRAGASLVQLYSALVYEGPGLARRMTRGLEHLMRRDGFASIAEAVGTE